MHYNSTVYVLVQQNLFYLMVEVYLHYCLRYSNMFRLLTYNNDEPYAHNRLNTYSYYQLPPTCFGVCYTIFRETITLLA